MTGERLRRLRRVVAWLLTPLVAWAASFLGGWLGAVIGGGAAHPRGGLLWLGAGALVGGVVGVVGWVALVWCGVRDVLGQQAWGRRVGSARGVMLMKSIVVFDSGRMAS